MMRGIASGVLAAAAFAALACTAGAQDAPVTGSAFLSDELKALQADEFAHPGMLWVGDGERLWKQADGAAGKTAIIQDKRFDRHDLLFRHESSILDVQR